MRRSPASPGDPPLSSAPGCGARRSAGLRPAAGRARDAEGTPPVSVHTGLAKPGPALEGASQPLRAFQPLHAFRRHQASRAGCAGLRGGAVPAAAQRVALSSRRRGAARRCAGAELGGRGAARRCAGTAGALARPPPGGWREAARREGAAGGAGEKLGWWRGCGCDEKEVGTKGGRRDAAWGLRRARRPGGRRYSVRGCGVRWGKERREGREVRQAGKKEGKRRKNPNPTSLSFSPSTFFQEIKIIKSAVSGF